ncbi:MAG: hypothetical protein J5753_03395 [Oscillospiraceae bacterium]|nr:hypothetical protein [Oscillospiraceae bacterium]
MKPIQILSESAAVGTRLKDILYQDGFADIRLSDLSAIPDMLPDAVLIVYAKSNISGLMHQLSPRGGSIILLLNPDCYALYLDRARHCGITLLLMPVAPFTLLEAVEKAVRPSAF